MAARRLVVLLLAAVGVSVVPHATYALEQKQADAVIEKFLAAQKTETEGADSLGSAIGDLNGDGKSEIVLVWALMGPTYWHTTLTVFAETPAGYAPAASLDLKGEAKPPSVKDGVIRIDQKVFAKDDPLCCPSIAKQGKYRWQGKKISEVK